MKGKEFFNYDEFFEFLITFFKNIEKNEFLERMKKLYFRFKSKIGEDIDL